LSGIFSKLWWKLRYQFKPPTTTLISSVTVLRAGVSIT